MKLNPNDIIIPPIPNVMIQVMMLDVSKPDISSSALEKILSPDKGITAELFRVSNSAFYGRSGHVKTLKDAITLLGIKTVKNLVILLSNKTLSSGFKHELYRKYLNKLPVLTALIGLDLANPLGFNTLKEEVFTIGLLKNIGMTILALNFRDKYLAVLNEYETTHTPLADLEIQHLETDHIEMGSYIFEQWRFPESLQNSVKNQRMSIENFSKIPDVDRISKLGELISARFLCIPLNTESVNLQQKLFEHYKVDERTKEHFGEPYFDLIQDHPFYEAIA